MFSFKIRPLGLIFILLAFVGVGLIGFALSRMVAPKPPVVAATSPASETPVVFSTTAKFAHIPATDPSVARALSADNLDQGKDLIGKPTVILGHVVKIFVPAGSPVYLINFAQKYSNAFSVVIEAKDYGKFPDPNELMGKQVLVHGAPMVFKKQLEVKAESLDQLRIVDGTKAEATAAP